MDTSFHSESFPIRSTFIILTNEYILTFPAHLSFIITFICYIVFKINIVTEIIILTIYMSAQTDMAVIVLTAFVQSDLLIKNLNPFPEDLRTSKVLLL